MLTGHQPRVAVEGDIVSLHYTCLDEQGQVRRTPAHVSHVVAQVIEYKYEVEISCSNHVDPLHICVPQKLESSRDSEEPVTFELGAGEVFANPVFKVCACQPFASCANIACIMNGIQRPHICRPLMKRFEG